MIAKEIPGTLVTIRPAGHGLGLWSDPSRFDDSCNASSAVAVTHVYRGDVLVVLASPGNGLLFLAAPCGAQGWMPQSYVMCMGELLAQDDIR